MICVCIFITCINYYKYSCYDITNKLKHYNYIAVSEELENSIKEVGKFIQKENNVLILDASAALFMIPQDLYNKDYDMFNKGNFGGKGEDGIINSLKSKENYKLLIVNEKYSLNWQAPLNVIEFVKNNYLKSEEIDRFDVYEKYAVKNYI